MTDSPTILAIDLGTKLGWALCRGGEITSGACNLNINDSKCGRFNNFNKFLQQHDDIDLVYYEYVRRHTTTKAAHVYGGFQTLLWMFCDHVGVPCRILEIGTIKKHWTGSGNAKKPVMIQEAIRRGFNPKDDNEADALAILDLALVNLGVKPPVQASLV